MFSENIIGIKADSCSRVSPEIAVCSTLQVWGRSYLKCDMFNPYAAGG